MKVYRSIESFEVKGPKVVTLGTFDGVHSGHRKILNRLRQISRQQNMPSVLLTFFPHPRMVLQNKQSDLKLLNTLDEKIALLESEQLDHLIIHPFTLEFSRMSHTEFVREMLVNRIGVKKLVVGYNHQFGRNREGSFEQLKELSQTFEFDVEEIPAEDIDEVIVSSTKIREALMEGQLKVANLYLGYDYQLSGKVVAGDRIGRSIGFPTANIQIGDPNKLIPANGVYAVTVQVEDTWYNGMLNIGNRPTVKGQEQRVEVHIFDFQRSIYDLEVVIRLKEKIRNEKDFGDLTALTSQLRSDKEKALKVLADET
ncbi:MAG: bifunctional riboflavin kinase/FAD synthetase [Flavobacteriales bacterium]|nr:bifunctional riboflavin kinase/FAD synthetase [Flavobacteriales bacterium]MCB9448406.1 bifunctional riboflavin kinase/FAD synthetase [Flavobacteriales bacterium]